MSLSQQGLWAAHRKQKPPVEQCRTRAPWLSSWEIYVVVAIAALLRLYRIDLTEFDADQADIFRMAHDAVSHGHLVATSNLASLGVHNPPATVYLLMIPAALSANPLWGAVFTAVLAILAVLLTYFFTRHYYGRVAATIAALTYATAAVPVYYSRFMWNQNFLLLCVPLFIAIIYRGVVERRPGWLGIALILLGLAMQLHGSGVLLAAVVVVALVLAWRTIRWYDPLVAVLGLAVLYAPYVVWLSYSKYRDFTLLFNNPKSPTPVVDNQSWMLAQSMLQPYEEPFTNVHSILYRYLSLFSWVHPTLVVLVIGGLLLASILVLWPRGDRERMTAARTRLQTFWRALYAWWNGLYTSPLRRGLVLLIVWQVVPVVALLRHSLELYPHYFIILLPGPFILLGFLLARSVAWVQRGKNSMPRLRYALYALAGLIVLTQSVCTVGSLQDAVRGRIPDRIQYNTGYTNDLSTLQQAVQQADRLAQQRHLDWVYLSADRATRSALRYLSGRMVTPASVVDNTAFVVPGARYGPAALLVPPYSDMQAAMAKQLDHASLVRTIQRPGGAPFRLYIVYPLPQQPPTSIALSEQLRFLGSETFVFKNRQWIASRWRFMRSATADYLKTYIYQMLYVRSTEVHHTRIDMPNAFSAVRVDDQFFTPAQPAPQLFVKVVTYEKRQSVLPVSWGPLSMHFDAFDFRAFSERLLKTADGTDLMPTTP